MSDTFDHEGDAWNSLGSFIDDDDDYLNDGAGPRYRESPSCKRCGEKGLSWRETPYGWRLFKVGQRHVCVDATYSARRDFAKAD